MVRIPRTRAAILALAVLGALGVNAFGDAAGGNPAHASAQAFARQDPGGARRDFVSVTGDGDTAGEATHVTATTARGKGSATASVALEDVDVFDGLVTAKTVRVSAEATGDGTSTSGAV